MPGRVLANRSSVVRSRVFSARPVRPPPHSTFPVASASDALLGTTGVPASAVIGETPIGTLASPQDCAVACANYVCDFSFPPLISNSPPFHRFATELIPRLLRPCSMDHIWRATLCALARTTSSPVSTKIAAYSLQRPKSTPTRSRLKRWSSLVVETA